jgi:hypothetical protein
LKLELVKHLEHLAATIGLTLNELIDEVKNLQLDSLNFTSSTDYDTLQKVYPELIFHEIHRLNELVEANQLYGVFLQIKDVFEVIAKYPVLYYVSLLKQQKSMLDDEQLLMYNILSQVLSLGHWESALKKITDILSKQSVKTPEQEAIEIISQSVWKIYKDNKVVKWRNDNIGHGALGNANKVDFKGKLLTYLNVLKDFFNQNDIQQAFQQLKYVLQQDGVEIQLAKKQVLEKVYLEKENNHLLLFDSFYSNKKLTGYLDYSNGQKHFRSHKHIEKDYKKFVQSSNKTSVLDMSQHIPLDIINEAYEQQLLTELKDEYMKPDYLFDWLEDILRNNVTFKKHLIMEEGMGKTTFIHAIDERKMNKAPKSEGFSKTTIRAIYFNSFIQDITSYFKNALFDVLTSMNIQGVEHQIPLYQIVDDFRNKPTVKSFLAVLEYYRKLYLEYTNKEQLLIILDGLDELSPDQLEWVQKILPKEQDLSQHITLLVTSRPSIKPLETFDPYVITREHPENITLLVKYLKKHIDKDDQVILEQLLPVTEYRFLYTRPLVLVQKFKSLQLTNYSEVVSEYLKMLHELYADKHCSILYEVFALLSVTPKALTLEQISYILTLEKPSFKVLGLMRDVKCWLTSYWENGAYVYEIRHDIIKQQFLQNKKIQSSLTLLQNMWNEIAIRPVDERLTEKEMLLFFLCKESTKQNKAYIQNIHKIIQSTYPFVESKREIEMLILLLRGAIPYEKKERVELLEYYLMEMHVVKGEQQTIYQDIKKSAYKPIITKSNFEAIGRTLVLDMIMGNTFSEEYPSFNRERYLDRAIQVKPYIDKINKQHIIGLNMAKSRVINWRNFTKEWSQFPQNHYLMAQAIESRIFVCSKDMNLVETEKIYNHFLKLVNDYYPIQILSTSYEIHINYLRMLINHYHQKHGLLEENINFPYFNFGKNGYSNIFEKDSIILYKKILNVVIKLNEIQSKLLALNHQNVTTDHSLTLNIVLRQSIEMNISGEAVFTLYETCNNYLRWINHGQFEKTPEQTMLLKYMEAMYKPVKDMEGQLTQELFKKVAEQIPLLDENASLNELLEKILTMEDEQLKSHLLYQGLRTKYIFVRNGAQPIGSRWQEYLSYLVESTHLKYYSNCEKGLLHFFYAYSIYERMMNDSMDEATFTPLYKKHLDVLMIAMDILIPSEPSNEVDTLVKHYAMNFTYEKANLEANLYKTGHRIVEFIGYYKEYAGQLSGRKDYLSNLPTDEELEEFLSSIDLK